MDRIELILTDLSEETAKRLAEKKKPDGLEENKVIARIGGQVAKDARNSYEQNMGESAVTSNNRLNYQYKEEKQIR